MQTDTYTKVVLTVIAIGVGFLAFDQNPIEKAQAKHAHFIPNERVGAGAKGWFEFLNDAGKRHFVRWCTLDQFQLISGAAPELVDRKGSPTNSKAGCMKWTLYNGHR
jgi:hypothetical protein